MMCLRISTLLFFLSPASLLAQISMNVEFKTGYASYKMGDLSRSLQLYQTDRKYDLDITDDYPAYVSFGGRLFCALPSGWEMGVDYSRYSTGGHVQRHDYSGQTGMKQVAVADAMGFFGNYNFVRTPKVNVKVGLGVSLYATRVDILEYLMLGDDHERVDLKTASNSLGITPSAEGQYMILKFLYAGARVGYCLGANGPLKVNGNADSRVVNSRGAPIGVDWSGFRSELFLGFRFVASNSF